MSIYENDMQGANVNYNDIDITSFKSMQLKLDSFFNQMSINYNNMHDWNHEYYYCFNQINAINILLMEFKD